MNFSDIPFIYECECGSMFRDVYARDRHVTQGLCEYWNSFSDDVEDFSKKYPDV